MRDRQRIQAECQLLERNYGADRAFWSSNYDWMLIDNFRLPPNYNQQFCRVLVLVPEHYGYGQPYRDLFTTTGLRLRHGGGWRQLPHYFESFPYDSLSAELVKELRDKKWSYLCLHPDNWKVTDNILTFMVQVYTFLSNPFYDWDHTGQRDDGYEDDDN